MKTKKHFYSALTTILFVILFLASTSPKELQISDGSRADGTLTLMYEYSSFQKPEVQWDKAKRKAIEKCKAWGYTGAEFFDVGTSACIQYNQYGCNRWRVTYKCQCTTGPSTQITEANISRSSSGTGFGISSDGYIVTNQHLTQGASNIKVRGVQGNFSSTYNAKIIAEDRNNDIAIIKIDDPNFTSLGLPPYTFSTITLDAGNSIFVLGYPLRATMGDEIKLTNGIISSRRGFQGDITSYQITAPVQPGNSGGPVFDKDGNVIGIINAKHVGAENASYAIKISYLMNLIDIVDDTPKLPSTNTLSGKGLAEQVKQAKDFVYIIEVN